MREFYDYLEDNMYKDTEGRPLSIEVVNSKEFVQRYRLAQKSFAEYNERNDIGNIHYKKHSDSSPALLIKIVNEAYSEKINIIWLVYRAFLCLIIKCLWGLRVTYTRLIIAIVVCFTQSCHIVSAQYVVSF